jgi:hypothetical protein
MTEPKPDPLFLDEIEPSAETLRVSAEYWFDRMAEPDASPEEASFAYETMLDVLRQLEVLEAKGK